MCIGVLDTTMNPSHGGIFIVDTSLQETRWGGRSVGERRVRRNVLSPTRLEHPNAPTPTQLQSNIAIFKSIRYFLLRNSIIYHIPTCNERVRRALINKILRLEKHCQMHNLPHPQPRKRHNRETRKVCNARARRGCGER